jgi:transcriptional regulator with XRE-family HTH domain
VNLGQRLGTKLRRCRLAKGWRQEAFADEAGIHRTYVSDIEQGARNPIIMIVEKLAKSFDVSAAVLLAQWDSHSKSFDR